MDSNHSHYKIMDYLCCLSLYNTKLTLINESSREPNPNFFTIFFCFCNFIFQCLIFESLNTVHFIGIEDLYLFLRELLLEFAQVLIELFARCPLQVQLSIQLVRSFLNLLVLSLGKCLPTSSRWLCWMEPWASLWTLSSSL